MFLSWLFDAIVGKDGPAVRAMLPAFVDVWLKDIYTPVGEAA